MKQIIFLTMLVLIITACEPQNTTIVGDVIIDLTVEPDPPSVGESTLLITVLTADRTPIDGAMVAIHADMDHEGMIPVEAESTSSIDGVYSVPFEWTMGGGWILNVTVTLPDNQGIASTQFEITVGAISQNSIINQTGASSTSNIQIRYESDNDPAIAGDAEITVIVLGTDGLPLTDVTVAIHATMPEHEMLPIDAETMTSIGGRYVIPIRWTMAGDWQLEITVTQGGGMISIATFEQLVVIPE